ncbi:MAG TPA: DUF4157 domain-containing protein [Fimbriimonadaceae bacterium]|nr:DUF4157 domain-containing protein [Fimbriimonadaceae bacterium]
MKCLSPKRCRCGGIIGPTGECENCRKKRLAREKADHDSPPASVRDALRSSGRPLDPETRDFMESRLGHDFGHVRVHTDEKAAEASKAIHAKAYTMGERIAFGANRYEPNTQAGKRLLAHELTHVVQQSHSPASPRLSPGGGAEHEAGRVANQAVLGSGPVGPIRATAGGIQRDFDDAAAERSAQLECVKRLGGCPQTRDAGIPEPDEIKAYNKECRKETGYDGPDITPSDNECAGIPDEPPKEPDKKPEEPEKKPEEPVKPPDQPEKKPEEQKTPEEGGKKVCITFDDGPQKGTGDCLDVLAGSIPATFFLTGKNMQSDQTTQKALVERILKEGHQIGNHTFTHDPTNRAEYKKAYGDLSDPAKQAKFEQNFTDNETYFEKLLGSSTPVFSLARLPGDGRLIHVGGKLIYVEATKGMGLSHVKWDFEFAPNGTFASRMKFHDWQGAKGVASEVKGLPHANDIILLHDRHWSGKKTSLQGLFDKLKAKGFTFGKIDAGGKCS